MGGCFKCGSTDHFLKDCPQRNTSAPTATPQMGRSAPVAQRGRRPARPDIAGTSQRPTAKTVQRQETRIAPHAYTMRAQDELEPADVIRGALGKGATRYVGTRAYTWCATRSVSTLKFSVASCLTMVSQ